MQDFKGPYETSILETFLFFKILRDHETSTLETGTFRALLVVIGKALSLLCTIKGVREIGVSRIRIFISIGLGDWGHIHFGQRS